MTLDRAEEIHKIYMDWESGNLKTFPITYKEYTEALETLIYKKFGIMEGDSE